MPEDVDLERSTHPGHRNLHDSTGFLHAGIEHQDIDVITKGVAAIDLVGHIEPRRVEANTQPGPPRTVRSRTWDHVSAVAMI